MTLSFDASAVAFERDPEINAEYLVLAERRDGSGQRLEIQRSLAVEDQDEALAQDTCCLVTTDGTTHYGGVFGWRIAGSTLSLTLDEAATQVLGVDGFRIVVPAAERATVQAALRELMT